jgi:hypothetical protein
MIAPADRAAAASTGVGGSTGGRGSFLLLGMTRDDFPALSAGIRRPRAGHLFVSVR